MPRVDVTVDDKIYERLRDLAAKRGLSLSSLVRSMVIDSLSGVETYRRVQDMAEEQGVDWVALMRRMVRERLDEINEEE